MLDELGRTDIVGGPVIVVVMALAAVGVVILLVRRPSRRWVVTAAIAVGAGLAAAVATWLVTVRMLDLFGTGLGLENYAWIAATFCGVGLAVASLWRTRWWRKAVAVACIPLFIATGTLAVNADYGLNRTLGSLFGLTTDSTIRLVAPTASSELTDLWKHWKPPADLPAKGRIGVRAIPNTLSGFVSRPAGVYLPPAALVPNAPRLPLLVMMMGQPGHPDPGLIASILDPIAARHHGLAPIVVIPDQLGNPLQDPLCLDTRRYGNARTFIAKDVVNWAASHLNVSRDHRFWTVGGYSNGGECALSFAVSYPQLFSNLIDISGEAFPASENPGPVLQTIFHGDRAAYDAVKPLNVMKRHRYPHTTAVLTAGGDDPVYLAIARKVAAAARASGMHVENVVVPNAGHVRGAVNGGLAGAMRALYPVLGLSAPGPGARGPGAPGTH